MKGLTKSTVIVCKHKILIILSLIMIGLIVGFNISEYNIPKSLLLGDERHSGMFLEVFLKILFNNIMVALLMSVFGFFTAGVLTCLLLFFNGLILGDLINLLLELNISTWNKVKLLFIHGPIELTAFILFSIIGLRGFTVFKKIYSHKTIKVKNDLPILSNFFLPTLLLIIAALMESIIIVI